MITKKKVTGFALLAGFIFAVAGLVSCASDGSSSGSGSGSGSGAGSLAKGVTSVTLSRSEANILLNNEITLTATVKTYLSSASTDVVWSSSDASVASVSDGRVTGMKAGSATITATSKADSSKYATCKVSVSSGSNSETIWRADEYEAQTCSDNQALGIMSVIVGGGSVSIDANPKSIDGYSFTKRLKFGGGGSTSKNSIRFTTTGSATITVYYIGGKSGESRKLVLADSTGAEVTNGTNDGTAIASFSTTSAVAAGTYYIYSAGSGINVYAVKIAYEEAGAKVYPSGITLDKTELSLDVSDDSTTREETLVATITNAAEVSSGYNTINWSSSDTSVATVANGKVTAKKAGTAVITAYAQYGTAEAKCNVTVTGTSSSKIIRVDDTPVGYASITPQTGTGTTVTTKTELVNALKNGGLIYVSGTIDVSEGCLPSEAGGTTSQLDAFVKTQTTSLNSSNSSTYPNVYTTYTAFRNAYAALCSSSTDDKSSSSTSTTLSQTLWKLNSTYGNKIKLNVKSNTTIIGLGNAVIKGGTIQISSVSNVTIRNLTIHDAYDPFPHHEAGDGFNAQWDGICLDGASNIWIDHCTIEDTMKYSEVAISGGSEKWQTYDGLCDMKGSSKNIVVSYCIFKNHDKTMLIGSGSGDTSGGYITIHHNKFLNCGQRLPMTTYPNMHVYNNSFERDSKASYSQQACIVGRYAAYTYVVENNYFGSGVKKCLTKSTSAAGSCYSSGNYFVESSVNTELVTSTSAKPFTPSYSYELEEASNVKASLDDNAGAGVCTVSK